MSSASWLYLSEHNTLQKELVMLAITVTCAFYRLAAIVLMIGSTICRLLYKHNFCLSSMLSTSFAPQAFEIRWVAAHTCFHTALGYSWVTSVLLISRRDWCCGTSVTKSNKQSPRQKHCLGLCGYRLNFSTFRRVAYHRLEGQLSFLLGFR